MYITVSETNEIKDFIQFPRTLSTLCVNQLKYQAPGDLVRKPVLHEKSSLNIKITKNQYCV